MVQNSCLTSPVKIQQFHSLGSTNECARQWFEQGTDAPFWIIADEQTNGRGRQGRNWVSLKGNLFISTGQSIRANGTKLTGLSLVSALALYDAVINTISQTKNDPTKIGDLKEKLQVKWPNDLLVNGAKLGGILIENLSPPNAATSNIIAGFGLNITSNPVVDERDTTSLHGLGLNATRDQIANALILSWDHWLKRWDNGNNFDEIKTSWQKHASPLGTNISVKIGPNRLEGKFAGLDQYGALKLEQKDGTIKLITGGELL